MKKPKDKEVYLDEIIDYINSLGEDDQIVFVSHAVSRIIMSGKFSHIERLGMLDCARVDVINNVINPDLNEEIANISSN